MGRAGPHDGAAQIDSPVPLHPTDWEAERRCADHLATHLAVGLPGASFSFASLAQASQGISIGTEQWAASQDVYSATGVEQRLVPLPGPPMN